MTANPVPFDRVCVSLEEAAGLVGLSPRTVGGLAARGEIRTFKVGARRLVRVAELERWAAALEAAETSEREKARAEAEAAVPPASLRGGRRWAV